MAAPWDRRSPAELTRVQGVALQKWLPSVVDFTSHWGAVASRLGVESDQLGTREDLLRFPTSRERELLAVAGPGAAGVVLRPSEDQVKAVASTGTLFGIAGAIRNGGKDALRRAVLEEYKPVHVHRRDVQGLAVAYSRRDLDVLHRTGQRAATILGLTEDDYLVSAIPAGPNLTFWGTYHLGLGSSMLALHPRGHGDGLGPVVESFDLAPTTAVAVLPDEAVELAEELAAADATVSRVRTIVLLGPVPTDEFRAEVAEAWRAAGAASDLAVLALWAPPESRSLWAEQREHPGSLVTYPDLEVIEVVDPLTGLVTDGPGDLVLSSIGWAGTALVRFQTGCWVGGIATEVDEATGRTAPRILSEQVPDTWQPTLATVDGSVRVDLRGIAATVGSIGSISNWIVELRKPTSRIKHDRLVLEIGGDVPDEDLARLSDALPTALGVEPTMVKVVAPAQVAARIAETGSVFVDLR